MISDSVLSFLALKLNSSSIDINLKFSFYLFRFILISRLISYHKKQKQKEERKYELVQMVREFKCSNVQMFKCLNLKAGSYFLNLPVPVYILI